MNKLMISLLMLIGICTQGFAADLLGKWKTVIEEDGDKIPCVLTITKTDLLFTVKMVEDDEEMGTIAASINVPGSYTKDGNKLQVNLKKEDVSVKLDEFKPKDKELKKMMEESPEAKDGIIALIEGVIAGYKDQMLGEESFIDGELTIKELTATTLTLQDDGDDTIVFTRVK